MRTQADFDSVFLPDEALLALAKELPTPFYLYDEAGIRRTCREILAAFAWNAGFRQYFAVKATPNAAILRILRQEGMRVVCSSAPELLLAQRSGFQGDEILFAPNYPLPADLEKAAELHTGVILDGDCLIDAFRQAGCLPKTVGLRFNPGGDFFVDGEAVSRPEDMKFGLTRRQIFDCVPRLRALGVEKIGLHAYLCGNLLRPGYYEALSRLLFGLAAELHARTGVEIAFVDLSGGLGLAYRPTDTAVDLGQEAQRVRAVYAEILAPAGLGETPVYTELSRYLTGPHGILVSRILYIKTGYRTWLGLDANAANLMRPMLYGAYHHISLVGKRAAQGRELYELVGSIPEVTDKMSPEPRPLPHAEVGDLVAIHDVGAHGHSMGYNYAGKLRSAEYLYRPDGSVCRIRRAETPEDYLATQMFPPLI